MCFPRLLIPPLSSFFLFGCRGTGKITCVSQVFPKAHVISLLDETNYQKYLANPASFRRELHAIKSGEWVFVDEIQRLPNLLNEVHHMMNGSLSPFSAVQMRANSGEVV